MKICIASEGKGGLDDVVSSVFGRCPFFTVVGVEDGKIKNVYTMQNPGAMAASGAGIQAAQRIVNEGCKVIISQSIGPNSAQVFLMANVDMRTSPGIKIGDAIERYMRGELPPMQVQSGMGMGRGMGRGRRRRW